MFGRWSPNYGGGDPYGLFKKPHRLRTRFFAFVNPYSDREQREGGYAQSP